jgi:hypothetical protein
MAVVNHLKNSFINEGDSSSAKGGHPSVPDQVNSSASSPLKGRDCALVKPFNSGTGGTAENIGDAL